MSYLVCEECGKYYELNEGKSSFSFTKCEECGGRLRYVESLNQIPTINSLSKEPPILRPSKRKCSKCGSENPTAAAFCLECGERLNIVNSATAVVDYKNSDKKENKDKNASKGISLVGVCLGFGFLILSLVFGVLALFGTNIPHNPADISYNLLMGFAVIALVVTIISGLLASYMGGSIDYKDGILNGGLVGVILGIFMGIVSGMLAFISGITVFGLLAVLGGILGTLLRRHLD